MSNNNNRHGFRAFLIFLLILGICVGTAFALMKKSEREVIVAAAKSVFGIRDNTGDTKVRSGHTQHVPSETEETIRSWFSDVIDSLQKNDTKTLKRLVGDKNAAKLKKYHKEYKLGPNEKLSIRVAEKDAEHIYFSLVYGNNPLKCAYTFGGRLSQKKDYWQFDTPKDTAEILAYHRCDKCQGNGVITQTTGGRDVCAICNGTGQQYIPNLYYDVNMGWYGGYTVCSGCSGSGSNGGSVENHLCPNCQGTGLR